MAIIALLGLALFRSQVLRAVGRPMPPPELNAAFPRTWQVLEGYPKSISLDDAQPNQWLVLYGYDGTPERRQIGGMVYTIQVNPDPFKIGIPINALPSAALVPYALLPDVAPGKGQGYLGDEGADPQVVNTAYGRELLVRGYEGGRITRTSVFWWRGPDKGFGSAQIIASGGMTDPLAPTAWGANNLGLQDVIRARDRLYDRDNLCWVREYRRPYQPDLTFERPFVSGQAGIEFCGGAPPAQPYYPEGMVLAYLLSLGKAQAGSYLTGAASTDIAGLQARGTLPTQAEALKVTSLTYPGQVDPQIQAPERVEVQSEFLANNTFRRIIWRLVRYPVTNPANAPVWQIEGAREG